MQQDAEGGPQKFWRPGSDKQGKFPIRILPPMKKNGEKVFYFAHKTHFINGIPYECLNQTITDKDGNVHQATSCPVCNYVSKLYSSSERDSDEWKLAGELKARKRYVSRIIVRGKEDEAEPEFYEYGIRIWDKLFNILTESDFGNILDPKNGRDFILHKTGTGRNSNYDSSVPSANTSPVFENKDDMVKAFSKATEMKYGDLVEMRSAEEMEKALISYIRGEAAVEEKGPETSQKPKTKPATKDEHFFNEEDLAEGDDELDETPEVDVDEIDDILSEFIF